MGGAPRRRRRLARVVAAWIAQLARGVLALALGVTIALTLAHTPLFGLVTFGVFAVLSSIVLLGATLRGDYAGPRRFTFLVQAIATLVAGILALAVPNGGVAYLGILVGAWALLTGLLEGASGILARGRAPLTRDWLLTGVVTALLGVVALVLPPDFVQAFAGERGQAGTLTSSVILVGVIGGWAIIVGVLQTISAVSVRAMRGAAVATS